MLRYPDGREVRVGDRVDLDGTPAIVFDTVETPDQLRQCGFEQPAVGFRTREYGEVYQSTLDSGWDSTIVLLKRAGNS